MTEYTRNTRDRASAEAGFTLLELLIAMTLLGLLMVVAFGGLRFGVRAWERTETHSTGTDEVRLTQTLLRREFSLAYPRFMSTDPTRTRVDFDGTADHVTFLGPAPIALIAAGRARITINRVPQGGTVAFVLSEQPELVSPDDRIPHSTETLLAGLRSIEFAYFGAEIRNGSPQWYDRWIDQTSLPKLIRVRAEFTSGDARVWPELVVATRISADVSCVFDVLTKFCRGR